MIVEWRARAEYNGEENRLAKTIAEERLLEIEMIEERELTLPPSTYPWDSLGLV